MLDECIIEQISINATCEKFRPDHEQFWAELFRVQEVNESDQTHFFGRLLHENDDLKLKVKNFRRKNCTFKQNHRGKLFCSFFFVVLIFLFNFLFLFISGKC